MINHGGNSCGWNRRQWFKCGACQRKTCYCFGGDSPLKSLVNLCDECWVYAMEQCAADGIDVEHEAVEVREAKRVC